MALPHQVKLAITYDGTVKTVSEKTVTESSDVTYTVKKGDNLWSIAKKYYGSGTKQTVIYKANKDIIEKKAKYYGRSSSDNGHWIYPGTKLTIPDAKTKKTTKTSIVKKGESNEKLGEQIRDQATAFSYTDVASGQSDSVSITLYDIDKEWLGNLMPKRGADIGVKMKTVNWNEEEKTESFNCGTFILDDISFSGRPLNCVLGGVSVPANDDFKTLKRTKTWKSTTVKEIASEIAKRAGVSLYYTGSTVKIKEMEQNKQPDSAFLYALCEKYGLAMKVYNKKIVIFDIVSYEAKKEVLTINEKDMLNWSYNTTIDGTYTGVKLSYTDPDSDKTISVKVGSGSRWYEMDSQASSKYDAELQATAKVNAANREIETMTITIRANTNLVASQCVKITGLGNANGKYYIDKIKHSVGNGYTMQLTLHKVQSAIGEKESSKKSSSKKTSGGTTYTVKKGDNLWSIAKKFYGSGTKHTVIYKANKDVIEKKAKYYGRSSSDNGYWIYPGTKLTIPEV